MTEARTLAPGLRRLLAPNPSLLTGPGTNTYLLGEGAITVIDPGPDLDSHLAAILAATAGQRVERIVVTHAHADHSGLALRLARATGAEVLAHGTAAEGLCPASPLATAVGSAGEGLDRRFRPDRRLADGDRIAFAGGALVVVHSPGHLGGHLCLGWGEVLFSGDHVMGWASTVVSPPEGDMAAYMASLERLVAGGWRRLLPGHGDPVEDPPARIAELVAHRRLREAEVLAVLAAGPARLDALVAAIYAQSPRALWPAASRNILAHLVDLESRNLVAADAAAPLHGPFRRT